MEIRLNSKLRELPHTMSVAELLEREKIAAAGTAVAINGKMVRRPDWPARLVNEGDDVLVISAAYGG